jgi:aldehyde:ferredoxin oxidoreductase
MKGYRGRVLRIDLSRGSILREEIPEFLVQNFIGGKGFGTWLAVQEIPPHTDPLGPDNKIIIVTGPGAGTTLPTAVRSGLFARAPLNGVILESYTGGSFGHFLKMAGYDMLIIEGTSEKPVFLKIVDDQVTIEDAADLWGKDIYETEDSLKALLGKHARVLGIGPAGEHLVRFACVGHDRNRHFGRMGSGAVMGSKRLKAVAVVGTGPVEVNDPEGFRAYVRDLNRRIKEHPGTGTVYPTAGTVNFVAKANALGVFPSHYWHQGEAKYKERVDFEALSAATLVRQTRCHGCSIGCAHINRIQDGPYAGIEIDGPEYETIYVFGGLCDVGDVRDIIKLNDLCDRLGVDTMHTGNLLGLLMDGTEQELIPGDFRIEFGDTVRMIEFIERLAARHGEWHLLGEGVAVAAERLGLGDRAIHVKGLEPAGYDPRGLNSMAMAFGVGNRGATHLDSNAYARDIGGTARDFELSDVDKRVDRFSMAGKAELVYNMINFNAVADCFTLCRFLNRDLLTWDDYSEMLFLLTGMEKSQEEFVEIANNIVTLGRWYNVKLGFGKDEDMLPDRFYAEPNPSGESKGRTVSKEDYIRELELYYRFRNWDVRGVPRFCPHGYGG